MIKKVVTAIVALTAVFVGLAPVCVYAQGVTAEQKKELIDYHNKVRSEVGVGPVTWSDEAAAVAQKWADYLDKLKSGADVISLHGTAA